MDPPLYSTFKRSCSRSSHMTWKPSTSETRHEALWEIFLMCWRRFWGQYFSEKRFKKPNREILLDCVIWFFFDLRCYFFKSLYSVFLVPEGWTWERFVFQGGVFPVWFWVKRDWLMKMFFPSSLRAASLNVSACPDSPVWRSDSPEDSSALSSPEASRVQVYSNGAAGFLQFRKS